MHTVPITMQDMNTKPKTRWSKKKPTKPGRACKQDLTLVEEPVAPAAQVGPADPKPMLVGEFLRLTLFDGRMAFVKRDSIKAIYPHPPPHNDVTIVEIHGTGTEFHVKESPEIIIQWVQD